MWPARTVESIRDPGLDELKEEQHVPSLTGSNPSSPANHDKYHAAGMAAVDAYGNACIDAGKLPTRQGCLDAAVRGIAAAVIRDRAREVVSKMLDTYIDDATGAQVSADWWPGDPVTHERAS